MNRTIEPRIEERERHIIDLARIVASEQGEPKPDAPGRLDRPQPQGERGVVTDKTEPAAAEGFGVSDLVVATLSQDEARSLTDEVKQDAERLWRKLVELYDGGAHLALGYSSWGSYFEAEFGGKKSQAYRVLEAGRVVDALDSPNGEWTTPTESQARELAPLLDEPELAKDAWKEAIEVSNGKPTATIIRESVNRRRLTDADRLTIFGLHAEGKTQLQIAKTTGLVAGRHIDRAKAETKRWPPNS